MALTLVSVLLAVKTVFRKPTSSVATFRRRVAMGPTKLSAEGSPVTMLVLLD
jgi:hypothetical protein